MPQDSLPNGHDFSAVLVNVALLIAALAIAAPSFAADAVARPHVFAPGVISGPAPDIAPAFVAGGKILFFSRREGSRPEGGRWSILQSARRGESWSPPEVVSFSGQWNDLEAAAAPSGKYLVFASDRPGPGERAFGGSLLWARPGRRCTVARGVCGAALRVL